MTDSPLTAEDGGILETAEVGPLALGEDPDAQNQVKDVVVKEKTESTACVAPEGTQATDASNPATSLDAESYGEDETKKEPSRSSALPDDSQALKVRTIVFAIKEHCQNCIFSFKIRVEFYLELTH